MSCGTCGTPPGFERVWLFQQVGKETVEFADQHAAIKARDDAGGSGVVKRVTRRKT
jgi:hypothetical protein